MKENFIKSILVAAVFVFPAFVSGCSKDSAGSDAETKGNGEMVCRTVRIKMGCPEAVSAVMEEETKTTLANYDTSGISLTGKEGRWHPMRWKVGDVIYDYCTSGVYMDYTLTDDDMLPPVSYEGQEAKCQVLYRVGDPWVTCYCKGPGIGNYYGFRTKTELSLRNGVPREQNGTFDDYHICLAQNHPDEDFVFENMQAFIRFETTGVDNSGELLGYPITKIEVKSLAAGEKMAGDVELTYDGEWRASLQDRGEDADSMITIIPRTPSGSATTFVKNKHYFVAVPQRRYAEGIRFNLYTIDTDAGETTPTRKGYVDIPGTTIQIYQMFNVHDLIKYCALLVTKLSFQYGSETEVEDSGIEIQAGHTGKILVEFTPSTATDKGLTWESSNPDFVFVAQDGSITAYPAGIGETVQITAKTRDEGNAELTVDVTVTPHVSLGCGDYGHPGFTWPDI